MTAIAFSLSAQEQTADTVFVDTEPFVVPQYKMAEVDTDTVFVSVDSLRLDTIVPQYRSLSRDAIDKQVTYSAAGQIRRDIVNRRIILTNQAVVKYGDIEIQADSMVFNMADDILYAIGRIDTTGKINGSPVFKEASNEFKSDELTYNFKTKKALVKNIITKQDEGLIHSTYAKLLEDGTSNISQSTYSTCDADPPHFYINLPRARVYPKEKIVSGPGNLVVAGIPLPLVIPFGFFPINSSRSSTGILFPKYGQERDRGYALRDWGYYMSINDYIDLSLRGDVYTNGTWLVNATSNYSKLYKYNGNLNFSYANNVSGQKGLKDYRQATNYSLRWSFNQDAKASPGSRFSASVDMSSSNYAKQNSYEVQEHVNTTRSSNISYSKTWAGTPFSISTNMSHNQNLRTGDVNVNLPKVTFTMSRINPLKGKKQVGSTKWYQDLQLQYTANIDNQIKTYDSLLFSRETLDNMRNGFQHNIPLSIQLRPIKNLSISPSMTYSGVLYTQKIEKKWDAVNKQVVKDTIHGVFYGHAMNPSVGASYNFPLFGTFAFTNPKSRVQAIRHVATPSVSFNFTPEVKGLSSDMYKTVQADSAGTRYEQYSIFEGGIYGTPSLARKSGSVSFSLSNVVEAKVFAKDDTTGTAKKVKIIDNLNIGTSYNIFAESMKWSPVSMSTRTNLMNIFNISANSSFSLYALDSIGRQIDKFYYKETGNPFRLLRFTNFNTSLDFSLDRLLKGSSSSSNSRSIGTNTALSSSKSGLDEDIDMDMEDQHLHDSNYGYERFEMPWTMNVSYTLSYNKLSPKPVSQKMTMVGSVTITKNMTANVTTGYDFDSKQITMTNIGIQRDLHCWSMNFSWIPIGSMQSWNFTIRAKASILKDLKYDRRKDFHDKYY